MINNAFDTAMKALTISPFDSTITAVDTALAAVCLQGLVVVLMFYSFSQVLDLMAQQNRPQPKKLKSSRKY